MRFVKLTLAGGIEAMFLPVLGKPPDTFDPNFLITITIPRPRRRLSIRHGNQHIASSPELQVFGQLIVVTRDKSIDVIPVFLSPARRKINLASSVGGIHQSPDGRLICARPFLVMRNDTI